MELLGGSTTREGSSSDSLEKTGSRVPTPQVIPTYGQTIKRMQIKKKSGDNRLSNITYDGGRVNRLVTETSK